MPPKLAPRGLRGAALGRAQALQALTWWPMNKGRGIQQPLAAALQWKQPRCLVRLSTPLALCGAIPSSGSDVTAPAPASPEEEEEGKAAPAGSADGQTARAQRAPELLFRHTSTCLGGTKAGERILRKSGMSILGEGRATAWPPLLALHCCGFLAGVWQHVEHHHSLQKPREVCNHQHVVSAPSQRT